MYKIAIIAVIAVITIQLVKQYKPDYAVLIKLAAIIIVIGVLLPDVSKLLGDAGSLVEKTSLNSGYIKLILKSLGISVVTQIAADMCRDSNEQSVATAVELAGKTTILILAMPVLKALISIAIGIIEV